VPLDNHNYTLRRLLRLWMKMSVNYSVMPLRISTITGFVLSGLGTIGGAAVILARRYFIPPGGWASLMAAILLLSGVQVIILGLIGEYLGRLTRQPTEPQSVVREIRHSYAFPLVEASDGSVTEERRNLSSVIFGLASG
jgi:hypothetical protein